MFCKVLSIVLVALVSIQIVPMSILSSAVDYHREIDQNELIELTEYREEYVKHFKKADGSYVAAIYSEAVHNKENGKWTDIFIDYCGRRFCNWSVRICFGIIENHVRRYTK